MANADILWNVTNANWPNETIWLTIGQVIALAPIGTNGINNRSTYDFAILTMLSTVRRNYVIHRNPAAQAAIDGQIVLTNRNNGIWRQWLNAQVRKSPNINIGPLPQAGGAGAGIAGEVINPPTNTGGENFIPNHQNHNNRNVVDDNLKKIIIDIRQAIKSDLLDNHKVEDYIKRLSNLGHRYPWQKYPPLRDNIKYSYTNLDYPTTLAEALIWKDGKWQVYKNFISYYSGSENNLESDIVYFAFAQHLKNKLNPIVDQHTIRAMWLVNTDLTDAEKESCKRYLMDTKGKWKESGSGNTAKECLKLYQKFIRYLQRKTIDIDKIDKLFMPLGKAIKKKYSNYTVLSEIL